MSLWQPKVSYVTLYKSDLEGKYNTQHLHEIVHLLHMYFNMYIHLYKFVDVRI